MVYDVDGNVDYLFPRNWVPDVNDANVVVNHCIRVYKGLNRGSFSGNNVNLTYYYVRYVFDRSIVYDYFYSFGDKSIAVVVIINRFVYYFNSNEGCN